MGVQKVKPWGSKRSSHGGPRGQAMGPKVKPWGSKRSSHGVQRSSHGVNMLKLAATYLKLTHIMNDDAMIILPPPPLKFCPLMLCQC